MARLFEHKTYNDNGDIVSETQGTITIVHDTRTVKQRKNAIYLENKTALNREVFGIFTAVKLVVGILLLVLLVRAMSFSTYEVPKFTDLLSFFAGTNNDILIYGEIFVFDMIEPFGEWVVFDELRLFLNIFINLFNVLIFLANGLISIIQYISVFFVWVFGV